MSEDSSGLSAAGALVVEDDRSTALVIRHLLERDGFSVTHAPDGREALHLIDSSPPPMVVILDLMLPHAGGEEIIRKIRAHESWGRVPVVVLTSKSGERDAVDVLEAGATDYVRKPFRTEELMARIRKSVKTAALVPAAPGAAVAGVRPPRTFIEEGATAQPRSEERGSGRFCTSCSRQLLDASGVCAHCGPPAVDAQAATAAGEGDGGAAPLPSRYKIQKFLGKGGMGRVYLCKDSLLDVEVAVKVLPWEVAANPVSLDQMRREAKTSARLRGHLGILQLFAFEQFGKTHYLVMEYAARGSLHDRIQKQGALEEASARLIGAEVADALAFAHRKRVLHGDIKPANILLSAEGRAKVADLGIARVLAETTTRMAESTVAGTPAYMPPELILGEKTDHRADLYALGCVLFEMVTGQRPFKGSYVDIAVAKTRPESPLPDPRTLVTGISDDYVAIVQRLLAPNPEDRYPDAKTVVSVLRDWAWAGGATGVPSLEMMEESISSEDLEAAPGEEDEDEDEDESTLVPAAAGALPPGAPVRARVVGGGGVLARVGAGVRRLFRMALVGEDVPPEPPAAAAPVRRVVDLAETAPPEGAATEVPPAGPSPPTGPPETASGGSPTGGPGERAA